MGFIAGNSAVVIAAVNRPRARKAAATAQEKKLSRAQRQQIVANAVSRNRDLPQHTGWLSHSSRGLFRETKETRWVVMDPAAGTLSIHQKPSDNGGALIKSFQLDTLEDFDSNPSFRNMWLRFDGETLSLTAQDDGSFKNWMQALEPYEVDELMNSRVDELVRSMGM